MKANNSFIEKKLNGYLKWISILLFFFALVALIWDFFPIFSQELSNTVLEVEETLPSLNAFLVSTIFAFMSGFSFLIYSRNKKPLADQIPSDSK